MREDEGSRGEAREKGTSISRVCQFFFPRLGDGLEPGFELAFVLVAEARIWASTIGTGAAGSGSGGADGRLRAGVNSFAAGSSLKPVSRAFKDDDDAAPKAGKSSADGEGGGRKTRGGGGFLQRGLAIDGDHI